MLHSIQVNAMHANATYNHEGIITKGITVSQYPTYHTHTHTSPPYRQERQTLHQVSTR